MARLIDANALVDAIKNRIEEDREIYPNFSRFSRVGMRIVISIIKKQDTVDSVKHGHWIVYPTLVSFLRCSQCHNGVGWHNDKKPNYCPNCGARMDGDAND